VNVTSCSVPSDTFQYIAMYASTPPTRNVARFQGFADESVGALGLVVSHRPAGSTSRSPSVGSTGRLTVNEVCAVRQAHRAAALWM
jgi:hypothetical protein